MKNHFFSTPALLQQISKTRLLGVSICIAFLAVAVSQKTLAQSSYETNVNSASWSENFDEIGTAANAQIPGGWVFGQGDYLPNYGAALDAPTSTSGAPDFRLLTSDENSQVTVFERDDLVGSTSTVGGRMNFGDAITMDTNRALGFASSSTSWISPTNFLMFGFTNGNIKSITNATVSYNVKRYSRGTFTGAVVLFYYSYDGTNWVHLGSADQGPFSPSPSGNQFLYSTGPDVSNVVVNINNLNVSVGSPFYFSWEFIVAGSTGANCHRIALDDFNMTLGLGNPAPTPSTNIWPNGAGSWNTPSKWQSGVLPTSPANLIFTGAGGSLTNNLTAISTGSGLVSSVYFNSSASGSYTVTGNGISIGAGITNDSGSAQTLNNAITLTADNYYAANSAGLNFGGAISNGGNNLNLLGNGNFGFSGNVSGAGDLIMSGGGTLNLNSSNSYTGATTINSGTVQDNNVSAIPANSAVTVVSGAVLNLSGKQTIAALNGGGNVNLANNGDLVVGSASTASGGFLGVIAGSAGFTMMGTATQSFQGSNTYTGSTIISNGTLNIYAAAPISTGNGQVILAGGTLQCNGTRDLTNGIITNPMVISNSSTIVNTANATGTGANRFFPFSGNVTTSPSATLTIKNIATGNYSNTMCLRLMAGGFNFSSPIVFDNSAAAHQTNETCQLDSYNTNGTTQTYSGVISGPGILRRGSWGGIAGGGGITILSGQNTYSGEPASDWATHCTYLEQGLIGFGSSSVVVGGNLVSGPIGVGDIEFAGGDPYMGVFASGGARTVANQLFFSGTTNTLLPNSLIITGTNALTFSGTLNLGATQVKTLLVSNTASTTFSGPITNSASMIKDGPGLLVLSGTNTYGTSATTNFGTLISSGTLEVDSIGSSGTGPNAVSIGSSGTLSGSGVMGGAVSGAGFISPGPGRAALKLSSGLDASGGMTYVWELGAYSTNNPGVDFDQIQLTGGFLFLGGSSQISVNFSGSAVAPNTSVSFWQQSHSWKVVSLAGTAANSGNTKFTSVLNGNYAAGYFTNSTDGSGNVILSFITTVPPVPIVTSVQVNNGALQINFTGSSTNTPSNFFLLTSTNPAGPFTTLNPAATVSQISPGVFKALTTISNQGSRFFRVAR